MRTAKPIRYGKPCMTSLPPRLGRMIIDAILNPPPFDSTKLNRDCEKVERKLAKIAAEVRKHGIAAN